MAELDSHLDPQRRAVRPAAVPDGERADAHLLHDGRAQLRPCQLLHAGCLLRLSDQPLGWLLAGADPCTGPRRPASVRWSSASACAMCTSTATWPSSSSPSASRSSSRRWCRSCGASRPVDFRVPTLLDFPAFTVFATNYPAYKLFMLADLDRHLRRPVRHADPHAHRPDRAGGADASAHGCASRPQRAAGVHDGVRRRRRRWPASPASSPGRHW